jgi:hypothetical protein
MPADSTCRRCGRASSTPDAEQRELFVDFDRTMRAQQERRPPSFAAAKSARAGAARGRGAGGSARSRWRSRARAQVAWASANRCCAIRERARVSSRAACTSLRCTVRRSTDRSRIALDGARRAPAPDREGALVITATLANQAGFTQSLPGVEIVLSDVDERRIAMRRFEPAEYVSSPQGARCGLSPRRHGHADAGSRGPGKNAVAFEFRFL